MSLPAESREEEAQLASLLLSFFHSPEGAEGMALLASRDLSTPRRFYIFPGLEPRVQKAVAALVEQYEGTSCEPPAADRTIFLLGSTEVWKQLPPTKRTESVEGPNSGSSEMTKSGLRSFWLVAAALLLAGAAQDTPPPDEQPPPVEERPPITSNPPAEPKQPPPPKPKPPAPPPAKKPSCLLPDAELKALMAVKDRALAACENTNSLLKVQKCREAEKEWDTEFARLCGPGSAGERRAKGLPDPPPAAGSAPGASASSPPGPVAVPAQPPTGSTSATPPPPAQKAAPAGDGFVGPQCPEVDVPLGKDKSTPRDNYLDRVAMPLLLPRFYKQKGTVTPAPPPGRIAWMIAQAMEESMTSGRSNLFNIQYDRADAKKRGFACEKLEPRKEYLSPTDLNIREKGWPPSNSKGMFLKIVWICDPTYPDPVAAATDYLTFLKEKRPAALTALTKPSATLRDFAKGLSGFGTGDPYVKSQELEKKLRDHSNDIANYLGRRLGALRLAAPCEGGLQAEIAAVEAAQAAAAAEAPK